MIIIITCRSNITWPMFSPFWILTMFYHMNILLIGWGWWKGCWAELGNFTLWLLRLRRMIQNDKIYFVILFCENNSLINSSVCKQGKYWHYKSFYLVMFFINQNFNSSQKNLEEVIRRNSNNVKGAVPTFFWPTQNYLPKIFFKNDNSIDKLVNIRFSL